MNNYAILAKFYDSMMGERKHEVLTIKSWIKQNNSTAKTVLDLGCGTGNTLKLLSEFGYETTGIDSSPEMLAIAKKKLPRVSLLNQDIRNFQIKEKFDVVLCLYDTINHLLNFEDWEHLFIGASKHLNHSGIFIFDLNTIKKLEHLAQQTAITKKFHEKEAQLKVTKIGNFYDWGIKILDMSGSRNKPVIIDNIREVSFPIKQVLGVLRQIFSKARSTTLNGQNATEHSDRVYFICSNSTEK